MGIAVGVIFPERERLLLRQQRHGLRRADLFQDLDASQRLQPFASWHRPLHFLDHSIQTTACFGRGRVRQRLPQFRYHALARIFQGTLGLLAPSAKDRGLQHEPQQVALVIRPASPPSVTFGNGTDLVTDPTIRVAMKQASIDFYIFSLDRFIREILDQEFRE